MAESSTKDATAVGAWSSAYTSVRMVQIRNGEALVAWGSAPSSDENAHFMAPNALSAFMHDGTGNLYVKKLTAGTHIVVSTSA